MKSERKSEPVGIENYQFFISNVMRDCPPKTVIYELLRNAIEATQQVGGGRVEWFRFDWNGTTKLGLYNEGVGMDQEELSKRMEIGSTGKELGFSKNFGQGAKMSAGAASPHGLLYRTCKQGVVWEILLRVERNAARMPVLCKVPQYDEYEGRYEIVRQVTDDAHARGRRLDVDWVEAILLGHRDDDNTLDGGFLGETSSILWLQRLINQRFYRFPAGIEIANATITSDRHGWHRRARGMEDVFAAEATTEKSEVVKVYDPHLGPVDIEYGRLAKQPTGGGPLGAEGFPRGSHVALVWRNEVYAYDSRWTHQASYYGFGGAADGYFLNVLIPDDAPIENNNHRADIIAKDDMDRHPLDGMRFSEAIRKNRPHWVLADIAARLEAQSSGRLNEKYRKLLERYKAKVATPVVEGEGDELGAVEIDRGGGQRPPGPEPHPGPDDVPGGRDARRQRGKPTNRLTDAGIQALFQPEDQEQWYEDMEGLAGEYDAVGNVFRLSKKFAGYRVLMEWANELWPGDEENGLALDLVQEHYFLHAMAFGMVALGFRQNEAWSPDRWRKCVTVEALSAHMMDPMDSIKTAVKTAVSRLVGKREAVEA